MNPPRPTLETLFLTEEELQAARKQVAEKAYQLWQAAGSPENQSAPFWEEAEKHWIEYLYVPRRNA